MAFKIQFSFACIGRSEFYLPVLLVMLQPCKAKAWHCTVVKYFCPFYPNASHRILAC